MITDIFHIKTIQPYFVFETDRFYQHIMASCGISHFFSYRVPSDRRTDILLVPDGCSNLLFAYGLSDMQAYVLGSTLDRKPVRMEAGKEYFGVRFQPGENPCFADFPVRELINGITNLSNFPRMHELCKHMEQAVNFNDRKQLFLEAYIQYLAGTDEKKQRILFRQFCRVIVKTNGIVKISDLEKLTGYSARYLNCVFTDELGISTKQFCSILKFQTILDRMNSGTITSLSGIAEDFRFYDQSHFIHDFERFTNETPSAYLQNVKNTQYRSRIIDL